MRSWQKLMKYSCIDHASVIVIVWSLLTGYTALGQNLLQNGSFEKYASCPGKKDKFTLNKLHAWKGPKVKDSLGLLSQSPDFFHQCSQGKYGVPGNFYGTQQANDGKGYIGIYVYRAKEFLQVKLEKPLINGKRYLVKLAVSQADRSLWAIDKLQALLKSTPGFSQIENSATDLLPAPGIQFLDNKKAWILLNGCYTARGNERYFTLGNFSPEDSISPRQVPLPGKTGKRLNYGYYYIDHVILQPCAVNSNCICPEDQKEKKFQKDQANKQLKQGKKVRFILKDIHFKLDDHQLLPAARKRLSRLFRFMEDQPVTTAKIHGYTDNTGSAEYNRKLSLQRAQAVYQYLVDQGIKPERLQFDGFGATRPIAGNDTVEGRRKNRRVEIILSEKN